MAMIPMEYGGGKKVISETASLQTSSGGTVTLLPVNYICAYVLTGGYYYPLCIYLYNNKYYAKGYTSSSGAYVALTGSTTYTILNYYLEDD